MSFLIVQIFFLTIFNAVRVEPFDNLELKTNACVEKKLANDTFKFYFRINEACLVNSVQNSAAVFTLRFYEVENYQGLNSVRNRINVKPVFQTAYSEAWDGTTPHLWPLNKYSVPQRETVIPAYVLNLPPNKSFVVEVIRIFPTEWKQPPYPLEWIYGDNCFFNKNNDGGSFSVNSNQILKLIVRSPTQPHRAISNKATVHIGWASN